VGRARALAWLEADNGGALRALVEEVAAESSGSGGT
jgi:hypothetical protein